jgi:8-oxo-dGTP pyrophosphatase MutT (NUDIX family)
MQDRQTLIAALEIYKSGYREEEAFIPEFLRLLSHAAAYQREHLPGHMTGSAWIVDDSFEYVLLTHHAKLNRWLQPGGHADGDENIERVAIREAEEETGLKDFRKLSDDLFDFDIHLIPERKGFPAHYHYDIRILLQANRNDKLVVTEESHDLAWVHVDEIATRSENNISMIRMAEKTRAMKHSKRK